MKAAILGALILTGCATVPPPAPERQPVPVAAPFARTWDAVIDVFTQRNIPIKTLDRSSGLIVAEQARIGVASEGTFANCGSALLQALAGDPGSPMRADYNIVVRGDSIRSTVRVTARFANANMECPSKGVFESQVEAAVKAGAEAPTNP